MDYDKMKIALIYPSDNLEETVNSNQDKTMAKFFGHMPHLGLAVIAACLEKAGHKLIIVEGNALNLSYKEIIKQLEIFKPDLIGFSSTTWNFPNIIESIKRIRKKIDVLVVVGGPHFTYYPKESLIYNCIDFIVIGDGVETIVELVEKLEKSEKDFSKIKGLGYKKLNKIIITEPAKKIIYLDKLPFPARHLLPYKKYFSFLTRKLNSTVLYTEYGCPGKCTFCDRGIGRELYRTRSAKSIFKEIKEIYEKFHIREILFYDASFTTNKRKVIDLCNILIGSGIKIEWSCSARADMVDESLLKLMKKAGCRRIQYGIETVNSKQLKLIKKSETKEQIEKALKETRKAGISPLGFFMFGLPRDTERTVEDNIKFSLSLDIDYASFSLTRSLPNTELYENQMKKMGYDYYSLYTLGKIPQNKKLPLYGTKLTINQVQEKIREAYWRFYFRPIQIFRIIKDTTSLLQIKRYFLAAMHMGIRTLISKLSDAFKFINSSQNL